LKISTPLILVSTKVFKFLVFDHENCQIKIKKIKGSSLPEPQLFLFRPDHQSGCDVMLPVNVINVTVSMVDCKTSGVTLQFEAMLAGAAS
jgi:hypothetical protein